MALTAAQSRVPAAFPGALASCPAVKIWARRQLIADEINSKRTNSQYLPKDAVPFQANISATSNLQEALADATVIVVAVPSQFMGGLLKQIAALREGFAKDAVIVSLVKSIHFDDKTMQLSTPCAEIITLLPGLEVTALMGPNIYTEIAQNKFAEATLGFDSTSRAGHAAADRVCSIFCTPSFHLSRSPDRLGVELCAALKNVISLAAGFCDGIDAGANARAAVIRLGLREIRRFVVMSGGSADTCDEACGVGDLILTCTAGRGRLLAAAFAKQTDTAAVGGLSIGDRSRQQWSKLEAEMFDGMKLPDWHNAQVHVCENENEKIQMLSNCCLKYLCRFQFVVTVKA